METYTKIGRYEIKGTLGKGAMGVVYKAVDPTIGRTVALKTTRLDVHGSDAEELLARFRNEARLAGVLNHPNIVTVYDAGEAEGLFYIAMEYMQGQTLHKLLSKWQTIPIDEMLQIAQQVCAGLDAAAAAKVVHRDIKPANIMIEASGTTKIMDFGIAKAGGELTSTGQVLGTPNYMSPEQVRGWPLDGRSDLFSLGVILYEMTVGKKPFVGDSVTTIIYKILNEDPVPPHQAKEGVHPGLSKVILRALAKSPDDRYQKGAHLANDLMNYELLMGRPPRPVPAAPPPPVAPAYVPTQQTPAPPPPRIAEPPAPPPPAARVVSRNVPGPSARSFLPYLSAKWRKSRFGHLPLPYVAGGAAAALVMLFLLVGGVSLFRSNRQTQQRQEELEHLLQQQQAPATAADSAEKPSPEVTPPSATKPPARMAEEDRPQPAAAPPEDDENRALSANSAISKTGQLVLNSEPSGAQVQIDGQGEPGWRTPYTAHNVMPGPHNITFILSGYAGETRIVDVKAGQQSFIGVTMKQQAPVGIASTIYSDPAGASVFIDGTDSGKLTPAQLTLAPGDHTLLLRKPGFTDLVSSIHVKEGQPFTYSNYLTAMGKDTSGGGNKFKKLFGGGGGDKTQLEVRTEPPGATITVNGGGASKKSPNKFSLQAGSYQVSIVLDGYKPLTKTVTIEKGQPVQINEILEKQ